MKTRGGNAHPGRRKLAFSRIELVVIVGTLSVLIFLLVFAAWQSKRRSGQVGCRNNLRQVSIAFRLSGPPDGDHHLTGYSTNAGGTKELIETGSAYVHFVPMSNELVTPKVLVCPADPAKNVASSFATLTGDGGVSYFVGTDAEDTYPQALLSGDRNLANQGMSLGPGLFSVTKTNGWLTWTKSIHISCGNICLADGSVQLFTSVKLAFAALGQGIATNRLAIP